MHGTVEIVPPAIDPLAPKNMALSPEDAAYVCQQFGIDVDRPLLTQVSRFDPWKDPLGVIDAYRLVKAERPEVQLALVGSMASDDPEGWDYFNATVAHADGDPDIHILNNFNNVGSIEVNAFQSQSDVLIQKSTREGFGLTVTEAIWKGRPFIGGNVGGIPLQVQDGVSGFLVDSVEACATRALEILADPGLGKRLGLARQGARAPGVPHAPVPARLPADLRRGPRRGRALRGRRMSAPRTGTGTAAGRLVLVSNRGPVTFQDDGSVKRGTGGLVTALTGLASHRDATWIASALSDADVRRADEAGGRAFAVESPGGGEYQVRLVASDADAYDRFYNVFANPMLWFIQHYLWDLSNAPDVRRNEIEAFEYGYNVVNEDLAQAVVEEIDGVDDPMVMVHDYHLYTLPGLVRRARPDVFLHHFIHIPWTQSDAWRVLPGRIREELYAGLLANDIIGFHTMAYRRNFLQCCRDLMGLEVDFDAGSVRYEDREVWVRSYPLPIDARATRRVAASERTQEFERELLRRRRDAMILRVDRADLSKNVLRGFSAFDLFLEQHPEWRERVTFVAQLMPSRTDVPEYAEYLERIEALVAVVNHRHGTPDWMPIQLKLRDDLEEAIASYKHYDVLLVNAMFDGMNLVAKEGPLVNERRGVSILSENTGAHEELGECALSVNPFDIQELADSIHAALTMPDDERARRAEGLQRIVTARDPGDWIDEQLADIRAKAGRT